MPHETPTPTPLCIEATEKHTKLLQLVEEFRTTLKVAKDTGLDEHINHALDLKAQIEELDRWFDAHQQPETPKGMDTFLLGTFTGWMGDKLSPEDKAKLDYLTANPKQPALLTPAQINYETYKNDTKTDPQQQKEKFGEYTLNPDTVSINWETIPPEKVKIIEIPDCRTMVKAGEYLQNYLKTHPNTKLPGLELYKYVYEHQDSEIAKKIKNGQWNFFFGSLFRHSDGVWLVPCVDGDASGLDRFGLRLSDSWFSVYRVVLLEN